MWPRVLQLLTCVVTLTTCDATLLRNHKRGITSGVPTYKLGHDLPFVSHSVLQPVVVRYPPSTVPLGVKVPLSPPRPAHRPRVPPRSKWTKFLVSRPGGHFHHHHHHIPPAVPTIPATPVTPVTAPSVPAVVPVPAPLPPPSQAVPYPPVLPTFPASPLPARPVHLVPHQSVLFGATTPAHPSPVFPAPTPVFPAPTPVFPAPTPVFPAVPTAPHYQYVIRPGNAVQTSLFATYPRYPVPLSSGPLYPVPSLTPDTLLPQPFEQGGWAPLVHQHQNPAPQQYGIPDHGHLQHYHDDLHQYTAAQDHTHLHQYSGHQHAHLQEYSEQDHAHPEPYSEQEQALLQEYSEQGHAHLQQYSEQEHAHLQQYPEHEHAHLQQYSDQEHGHLQEYGPPEHSHPHQYEVPEQQFDQSQYGAPQARDFGEQDESAPEQLYHDHIPLGLQPPIDRPLDHFT